MMTAKPVCDACGALPLGRSLPIRALRTAALALVLAGCGDDGGDTPDAGPAPVRSLEIVSADGDSIGLPFSGSAPLTVRLAEGAGPDTPGRPISGEAIEFELVATAAEDTGGSTLSQAVVSTSDTGIASVDVTAGTVEASFRVQVRAPGAPTLQFFVAVSDAGFATLRLSAQHAGPRPDTWFSRVEYRLFLRDQVDCDALDVDALPTTILPERGADSFTESVTFDSLIAAREYVAVVWGEADAGGTRLAAGCSVLPAETVLVGPALRATIGVVDRPLDFSEPVTIVSALDTSTLEARSQTTLGLDPWLVLACPLGAAQLALDCALDALVPDGALDCAVGGSSAVLDAVEALRGPVDGEGCRPATEGGGDSIDKILADRIVLGDFAAADVAALAAARLDIAISAELTSELSQTAPAALRHQLRTIRLSTGGADYIEDLVGSNRPVVEQSVIDGLLGDTGIMTVLSHPFTLDLGDAYDAAFTSLALAPASLDDDSDALGSALVASFEDAGASTVGCAALSSTVCSAIANPDSCLLAACGGGSVALNTRLSAWKDFLATGGLDVVMFGTATYADLDSDLSLESIGRDYTGTGVGGWTMVLETTAGQVEVLAVFESEP